MGQRCLDVCTQPGRKTQRLQRLRLAGIALVAHYGDGGKNTDDCDNHHQLDHCKACIPGGGHTASPAYMSFLYKAATRSRSSLQRL